MDDFIEGDLKNFSDTISEDITDYKNAMSDDIDSEFKALSKLNIETNKVNKILGIQMNNISWKTYRIASFGIIFISIFLAHYIRTLLDKRIDDEYMLMILDVILVFLIFNLCIFLFYNTYFKYITTKKGAKGLSGNRGKRGIPGKNDNCDTSTQKIGNFYREKNIIKKEVIENDEDNTVLDFNKLKQSKKGWYHVSKDEHEDEKAYEDVSKDNYDYGGRISNNNIGIKCDSGFCNGYSKSTPVYSWDENTKQTKMVKKRDKNIGTIEFNSKPIIGASVNYNKNTNKIAAIQYSYDKNKHHNPKKYVIGNFGSTKTNINAGTIGDYSNQGKNIQKHDFTCPPNSAIYKVEGMYDSEGLRGIKYHCQDIKTGKLVKAYNSKNRKVHGVTFGLEPDPSNENYHYDKSECTMYTHNNKYYPTFISNIGGEYDIKKKNIQNLSFNKCSLYHDDK